MVRHLFASVAFLASSFISVAALAKSLPPDAIARSAALTSIFENSTTIPQYCYVENIHDGRGYTAGIAGFTSATGDLLEVVDEFLKTEFLAPSIREKWKALLPRLEAHAKEGDGETSDIRTIPALWKKSCKLDEFNAAQDRVVDRLYRNPTQNEFDRLGFSSPLAFAILFDAVIQHGLGGGDDSYEDILRRMPPYQHGDQRDFAEKFLETRREILMNPQDPETRDTWRESVGRVDALEDLVSRGAWDLPSGTRVVVWGHSYELP